MTVAPILLFWLLAALALRGDGKGLLYLLFGALPLGSFAVLPPSITGGLTFTPAPVAALLLSARVLMSRDGLIFLQQNAGNTRRLGLLTLFWITAALVTVFAPRMFMGVAQVIEMRTTIPRAVPLQPTTQNLSQFAYLTISVLTVFAFAHILKYPSWHRATLRALLLGGCVAVMTGLLDLLASRAGLSGILSPLRTATYALLIDVEVLGVKRVVGLMPEASAYGALCVSLAASLHFLGRLSPDAILRDRVRPVAVGLLVLMTALSTSSSAYLGLIAFAAIVILEWGWRLMRSSPATNSRLLAVDGVVGLAGGLILVTILIVRPETLAPAVEMFDRMVLQKTSSASFAGRSMWNEVSMQALWDTHGVGVGVGGTRASSQIVSILTNTGVLGFALFVLFLLTSYLRNVRSLEAWGRECVRSGRWALFPSLVTASLVGTSVDFGLLNALLLAAMIHPSAYYSHGASRDFLPRPIVYAGANFQSEQPSKTNMNYSKSGNI